jgi:hypothetical protein
MANVTKYLYSTVIQGGADAFICTALATDLNPSDGYAFKIVAVEGNFSTAIAMQGMSADCKVMWALSRDIKVAMADLNDTDLIFRDGFYQGLTTSGAFIREDGFKWVPNHDVYIVEPNIYLVLDSDATGIQISMAWRIYYEEVKLTEVEILRLINNA